MDGGVTGFFWGLGEGVAGAIAKPVAGVGHAVADLTQGVTATVNEQTGARTADAVRIRSRLRSRMPRMLYSVEGVIHPWSELDARVLRQLGGLATRGVQASPIWHDVI